MTTLRDRFIAILVPDNKINEPIRALSSAGLRRVHLRSDCFSVSVENRNPFVVDIIHIFAIGALFLAWANYSRWINDLSRSPIHRRVTFHQPRLDVRLYHPISFDWPCYS